MKRSLIIIVALVSCERAEPTVTAAKGEPAPVEVVQLAPTTLEATLRLPGELSAYESVDVFARVAAAVSSISVDRGTVVRKGDVLVRLSAPEVMANRAGAEAKAAAEASTYARLQTAARTEGAVAAHEVELARMTMEAERARAASFAALEGYLTIRAPFDGVITQRNVHPGASVSPTESVPLLRIENLARLRLTVAVPEHALGTMPLGSLARFAVSAYPGVRFSGKVTRPAGSLDRLTRTMPVEVDVANDDGRLAPGSYAEVEWPVRHERAFVVPRAAIVQTTSRSYVVCVRDGKVARIDVRRGLMRGDDVEVLGSVADGDLVVKRGSEELGEGSTVQVVVR